MGQIAQERGLPVIGEYVLGASSEELEPYLHLSHPLVTVRGLRAMARTPGIVGLKEYYGLAPDLHEDVTKLICELTAYNIMHTVHGILDAAPKTKFRG